MNINEYIQIKKDLIFLLKESIKKYNLITNNKIIDNYISILDNLVKLYHNNLFIFDLESFIFMLTFYYFEQSYKIKTEKSYFTIYKINFIYQTKLSKRRLEQKKLNAFNIFKSKINNNTKIYTISELLKNNITNDIINKYKNYLLVNGGYMYLITYKSINILLSELEFKEIIKDYNINTESNLNNDIKSLYEDIEKILT